MTTSKLRQLYNIVGIRSKIMGIILAMVLLLGLTISLQVYQAVAKNMEQQLQEQGVSLARDVAARSVDYIFTNNLFSLYDLAQDTMVYNRHVRYILILDSAGNILTHTFPDGIPRDLRHLNTVASSKRQQIQIIDSDEGPLYDVAVPIAEGRAGMVRVGMTLQHLYQNLYRIMQRLILTTVLVSLVGVLLAFGLTALITRPINRLVEVAGAVAAGNFRIKTEYDWAKDELGQLGRAVNSMIDSLARSRDELTEKEIMQRKLLGKVVTAQEEERKRIARELHDQTSQSLASFLVRLILIEESCPGPRFKGQVEELRASINQTLIEVRDLAWELRPSILDDLGLEEAIVRYINNYRRKYAIRVDFEDNGLQGLRFVHQVEVALYRIIQEALTNIAKHAQAHNISIIISNQGDRLLVIIEDDGIGFDVDLLQALPETEKRLGLFGMQERVSLIAGTFTVESTPGEGTTIFISIPLKEALLTLPPATINNND